MNVDSLHIILIIRSRLQLSLPEGLSYVFARNASTGFVFEIWPTIADLRDMKSR
ncbi:hypothetical protein Mapa_012609 [Marchantia paleacea]|nr:hypothetical protein Mapa_012609 [Marchantia paleacea]